MELLSEPYLHIWQKHSLLIPQYNLVFNATNGKTILLTRRIADPPQCKDCTSSGTMNLE